MSAVDELLPHHAEEVGSADLGVDVLELPVQRLVAVVELDLVLGLGRQCL